MTGKAPDVPTQALAFASLCRTILGRDLIGVYLHGSLVSGGLHPQSDLDLLLVSAGPLSDARRATLLSELLTLSARNPSGPDDPRCLDVLAVSAAELKVPSYPARSEFIYGEWLRTGFEAGDLLAPVTDPVVTLMIAQARSEARAIFGPSFDRIMTELPADQVHQALLDSLPPLLDNLVGDERNVLLTLARMWRTAIEGDFVGKDVAANWAADRSPVALARTLRSCGLAYRGAFVDDWRRHEAEAREAAAFLRDRLLEVL